MIPKNNSDFISDFLQVVSEGTMGRLHFEVSRTLNIKNHYNLKPAERINNDFSIFLPLYGSGIFKIEDTEHPFENNRIYIIGPRVKHLLFIDKDVPMGNLSIRFQMIDNQTGEPIKDDRLYSGFSLKIHRLMQYQQLFEQAHYYQSDVSAPRNRWMQNAILSLLFNQLHVQYRKSLEGMHMSDRIMKVNMYIKENADKNISLKEAAAIADYSPKYFSKCFHAYNGMSFKRYIFECKMNYAKFLLEEHGYSIKEAAIQTGYFDQYIFSNQFKAYFGVSPSQWND